MGGFRASFINEIEKLYKKKKAVIIFIVSIIAIVIGQLVVLAVRNGFGLGVTGSSEFSILVLSVFNCTILPLFTALVAIDMFTGEFSQNTMKIILVRPVTRLKLFSAKITAIAFFILVNLVVVMVLSSLTGLLFNSSSANGSMFLRVAASYLVSFVPMMMIALIIVFLACVFRSSAAVLFLGIILFIVSKVFSLVYPQFSSILVTSMLDWYKLWIAANIPVFKILRQFLIMTGYGLMFFTAGYYMFDKKDI